MKPEQQVWLAVLACPDRDRGYDSMTDFGHPDTWAEAVGNPGHALRSILAAIGGVAAFAAGAHPDGPDVTSERDRAALERVIGEIEAGVTALRDALNDCSPTSE